MNHLEEIKRLANELNDNLLAYKTDRTEVNRKKCIDTKDALIKEAELLQEYLSENPRDEEIKMVYDTILLVLRCFDISPSFKPVEVH